MAYFAYMVRHRDELGVNLLFWSPPRKAVLWEYGDSCRIMHLFERTSLETCGRSFKSPVILDVQSDEAKQSLQHLLYRNHRKIMPFFFCVGREVTWDMPLTVSMLQLWP